MDARRDASPAPRLDGALPRDATLEDPARDAAEPLVRAHRRELRGAWVPSVYNLVFPSRIGQDEATARAEIVALLDALVDARVNAVFLQIRPESDALYASSLEPWSRFLTGAQGRDPGFDPLAIWIDEAHARAIELHAW